MIYYSKKESASEAERKYNQYEINGKKIKINVYDDEKEKISNINIFYVLSKCK